MSSLSASAPNYLGDQKNDFFETWAFPMALKAELKAASFEVVALGGHYRSGRPKYGVLFHDAKKNIIAQREAMQLTAKSTGRTYFVCRSASERPQRAPQVRQATAEECERFLGEQPRPAAPVRQAQQAQPTLEDLLGE